MKVEQVRDVIALALKGLHAENVKVRSIGNSVHLYVGVDEFEVVVKTMSPKGPSRLDRNRISL